MPRLFQTGIVAAAIGVLLGCRSEEAPKLPPRVRSLDRVFVVKTEGLDAPRMGAEGVYSPRFRGWLDSADHTAGEVVGFYMYLVALRADHVQMRLVHEGTGAATALERAPVADPGRLRPRIEPADLHPAVRQRLQAGAGVFWPAPLDEAETRDGMRFGVLLPAWMLQQARLDVFAETGSGSREPLLPASLRLAPSYFYMAAIGDSMVWGNGLLEEDKFTTRVARTIAEETGQHVVRQIRAVSGARIVPHPDDGTCTHDCDGEVPRAFTSITVQAQELESPEALDLVLMDGCINDVGVFSTLLSVDVDSNALADLTRDVCETEMVGLLRLVRERAPNAVIVVTGYFQFVSVETDVAQLEALALSAELPPEDLDELRAGIELVIRNSAVFDAVARQSLQRAVATAMDATRGHPPIVFVDPGFGPQNAVFAPDAFLWGLVSRPELEEKLGVSLPLFPEDPLLDYRAEACRKPEAAPELLPCLYASVGHNNPKGARRYADAIVQALRGVGVLPATPPQ